MNQLVKPIAIVLTDGLLHTSDAKTAHGLIRGTDRFIIAAVIDSNHAGKDAGEVLDGKHRNIPVLPDVETAIATLPGLQYGIIGVATVGGILPRHFMPMLRTCLQHGISLVNGLHDSLSDYPEMVELAAKNNATLTDIHKPKARRDLHFWTGEIFTITAPIIAVLGTDCALGKRTTCRLLMAALQQAGINGQMIYTGQTGWMQGIQHGFIFDSTLNDFISGELEYALVSCWKETGADIIFIEGQSAQTLCASRAQGRDHHTQRPSRAHRQIHEWSNLAQLLGLRQDARRKANPDNRESWPQQQCAYKRAAPKASHSPD